MVFKIFGLLTARASMDVLVYISSSISRVTPGLEWKFVGTPPTSILVKTFEEPPEAPPVRSEATSPSTYTLAPVLVNPSKIVVSTMWCHLPSA